MTASLFLVAHLPADGECVIEGPEGHHAATVQRIRAGEEVRLGDGRGGIATAVVTAVGRGTVTCVLATRAYEAEPDPRLVVIQGIPKGERAELAVQAMTEVGVDAIVPWPAARSIAKWPAGERGDKAHRRWVDTAREAAKQSRRAWVPMVAPATARPTTTGRLLVLHEEATVPLSTVHLPASGEIALVVGPEGGITPDELAAFEKAGATAVRLGANVLRTSTAGVAALAVLATRLARW